MKSVIFVNFALLLSFHPKITLSRQLLNPLNIEFAKDLSAMAKESNFGSDCETNTYIFTPECGNYINYIGKSLSHFGPPNLLTDYHNNVSEIYDKMLSQQYRFTKFHHSCHLVFICAMFVTRKFPASHNHQSTNETGNETLESWSLEEEILILPPDFFFIPDLIENNDHTIYLSNIKYSEDMGLVQPENRILNQTGILLSVQLDNQTMRESSFQVYSRCKYCGRAAMNEDLGVWKRNRSVFSEYLNVFSGYQRVSFHGYESFQIGFVDYSPHISCTEVGALNCSGIEWEMLQQISNSLSFNFELHNFTERGQQGVVYEGGNITGMIGAIKDHQIDIAIGGISISPDKASVVDFTNIFTNQPIVFIVQKRTDLYILGIWLAFAPEVWPLIIFTIISIAIIIKLIMWRTNHRKRTYKPSTVESLEISIQPLLGQPLAQSQIPKKPRRLLKLVLGIWWFSCLIISTVYNTNLITSLINPVSPKEPESLEDLLISGYRFKVGSKQSAVSDLISKGYNDTVIKQIQDRLLTEEGYYFPIAYIVEESAVAGIDWKEKGLSSIRIIRERLFLTGYGWLLKKQAPYKDKLNTAISQLSAGGCVQYWYEKFTRSEKKPLDSRFRLREQIGQVKLNLELMQGAFIFLILGSCLAGLVLGGEIIHSKYTFRFFTRREILGFSKYLFHKVQTFNLAQEVTKVGRVGFIFVDNLGRSSGDRGNLIEIPGYYPFLK
ncbi:unnamed protein product [Allacma fusca]|uniref:Ionotropic glutamate receptor C-terminal domain-containing protein n=1 Tax=Allacma fusca TaxID=39272 RepID=A0A8J2PTF7_9HEXA|nr:unnamed protein product [Allacma fusca]